MDNEEAYLETLITSFFSLKKPSVSSRAGSPLLRAFPSGPIGGAGKVSQSTSSQKSLDQSALQMLTRRSALAASHRSGEDRG